MMVYMILNYCHSLKIQIANGEQVGSGNGFTRISLLYELHFAYDDVHTIPASCSVFRNTRFHSIWAVNDFTFSFYTIHITECCQSWDYVLRIIDWFVCLGDSDCFVSFY